MRKQFCKVVKDSFKKQFFSEFLIICQFDVFLTSPISLILMFLKSPLPVTPFDINYHRFEFVHIPKCGGTSLHRRFSEVLGSRYQYGKKFLEVSRATNSQGIHAELGNLRKTLLGAGAHTGSGLNPINQIAPYGVVMIRFAIIRDPLQRLASLRRHCLDHPAHRLNQQLENPSEATFKQFILANRNDKEINNPMSFQLAGAFRKNDHIPRGAELIEVLVKQCIIDAIFTLSDMNSFHKYINKRIPGFGKIAAQNVSRSAIPDDDISEARDLVHELCDSDYQVYKLVSEGILT